MSHTHTHTHTHRHTLEENGHSLLETKSHGGVASKLEVFVALGCGFLGLFFAFSFTRFLQHHIAEIITLTQSFDGFNLLLIFALQRRLIE